MHYDIKKNLCNGLFQFEQEIISRPRADNTADFRDPKVWFENGNWFMVLGSQSDLKLGEYFYIDLGTIRLGLFGCLGTVLCV